MSSDSHAVLKAVLKALGSTTTCSSLVAQTRHRHPLKELSLLDCVRLAWVPGHSNVAGNETGNN